jgi:oxygen-independent coproporphyrinogen-3 oxidase
LEQGIYIHIPFCLSKCRYCAFNSVPARHGVPGYYFRALLTDAEGEAARWGNGTGFGSVFLGGGTPSLLSLRQIEDLMDSLRTRFAILPGAEISVECNPNTVSRDHLSAYGQLGINRISLGIQSLSDGELRFLGRQHTGAEAIEALDIAASISGLTVSADLIAGIPGQTGETLSRSLRKIVDYVEHVSVYLLSVEHGTELDRMVGDRLVELPDDDLMVELYGVACDVLSSAGFRRYEISNWSRPGYECVHNKVYWARGDYLGLGAGAHSHIDGFRYSKACDPEEYARLVSEGGDGVVMHEHLGAFEMFIEDLMLGLRMEHGIAPVHTARKYGVDPGPMLGRLNDLFGSGHVSKIAEGFRLSAKGMMLHDAVVMDLISAA